MTRVDVEIVQNNLGHLVAILGQSHKVATYTDLAARLSTIARRNGNAWSWRYVQSVHTGSVEPSKKFARAVEILAASMDGLPVFIAETAPVTVHARPGSVRENSIVLGSSKPCANPTCTIHFVPTVPWQKYCPRCRKQRQRYA